MTSFKEMIKGGVVKRADAMQMRLSDLHEEPGFNLRPMDGDPEFEASVIEVGKHIAGGGKVPPLEVRPRPEGGAYIVDGHRRRRGYLWALEQGAPLRNPRDNEVWVHVTAFEGNDADRTARVLTSATGMPLSPLSVSLGYKRLIAFGWTVPDIANKVSKSGEHVRKMLELANAPSAVQVRVAKGEVSASQAIKLVHEHGDKAGEVLAAAAEAKPGKKIKPKDLKPATKKAKGPTDAEMFAWLAEHSTVGWDLDGDNVEITFALKTEGFNDLRDAVRKGMGA